MFFAIMTSNSEQDAVRVQRDQDTYAYRIAFKVILQVIIMQHKNHNRSS